MIAATDKPGGGSGSGGTSGTTGAATEKGDLTRRHILDAAANAFARAGYTGTSLNDLIKEAGITKGGFYFHFPSKEALALAVIQDKHETWMREVSAAALQATRGIDQLTAVSERLCDLYEEDPSFGAMGKLCRDLATDPGLAPQVVEKGFVTWVELTAALLARAQEEGDVRPDLDLRAAAETAVAAFIGMKDMSDMESGGSNGADLRRRVRAFRQIFLEGMLVR